MSSRLFQHDITFQAGTRTYGRLRSMGWLDCTTRVCLVSFVWLCLSLVFSQAVADRYSRQQTPEGFRKAIHWEPWNPDHYAGLARALERPLKEGDLLEVVRLYEKAVQLSPHNAIYWARLGQAYEWAGRVEDAQNAHEQAMFLSPSSPTVNWTMATSTCVGEKRSRHCTRSKGLSSGIRRWRAPRSIWHGARPGTA